MGQGDAVTVEDLRWKLREFDDDTPVVVYRGLDSSEPVITTVWRDAVNDEGKPYREWIVTL
jgi:hypothetical protein